jgi:hypothetical protein
MSTHVFAISASGSHLPAGIFYSAGHTVMKSQATAAPNDLVAEADAIMYEQKRLKRNAAKLD